MKPIFFFFLTSATARTVKGGSHVGHISALPICNNRILPTCLLLNVDSRMAELRDCRIPTPAPALIGLPTTMDGWTTTSDVLACDFEREEGRSYASSDAAYRRYRAGGRTVT